MSRWRRCWGILPPPSESIDDDTLLKSPLGATASDTPAPSVSTGAAVSKSSRSTNRKRKPEAGPTPPQGSKKKKKSKRGPRLATFEQAAKEDLLGVVLVQDNPYQILTKDQIAWLRTTLGNRVDAVIDSDAEFIPRFTESGVRNGRFCLSCANEESFSWLASLMDTLEGTDGQGGTFRFRLALPSDIPKLTRAEVYITGPPPGVPRFLKNLKAQNPNLHTERWALKHQQQAANYQLMVFGIDPESLASLEASDFQAYFRLGRVTFTVGRNLVRKSDT